jgi:ribosomal protein S12 methylthiotransferase
MEIQQKISREHHQKMVGSLQQVLVGGFSSETDLLLEGRNQYQGPEVDGVVYINEGNATSAGFHQVEITEAHEYDLVGKILN